MEENIENDDIDFKKFNKSHWNLVGLALMVLSLLIMVYYLGYISGFSDNICYCEPCLIKKFG